MKAKVRRSTAAVEKSGRVSLAETGARLGVNIDHIATLRQLRGTPYPDVVEAALICERAGAHQITVHLREDRRHIQDADVVALRKALKTIPLNLEMACTDAMVRFARKVKPGWVCLVPEKRTEVTTEGGLELKKGFKRVEKTVRALKAAGIRVSLFVEPSIDAMQASAELGADAVELHTGRYCLAVQAGKKAAAQKEFKRIDAASRCALELGLHVHAGHGIDLENVRPLAKLPRFTKPSNGFEAAEPLIEEFNIGHFIVCRAAIVGLERAVREMLSAIQAP